MKLSKLAIIAAIACGIHGSNAKADQNGYAIQPVSHVASCDQTDGCDSSCDGAGCGAGLGLFDSIGACNIGEPWTLFGEH
ncbi:MAG TPA: hypothetical protein DDZ51_27270, partial [Planctomycetaceae bacterium]|nr:hypothetical protein [Planctomycetaceae bacterium]